MIKINEWVYKIAFLPVMVFFCPVVNADYVSLHVCLRSPAVLDVFDFPSVQLTASRYFQESIFFVFLRSGEVASHESGVALITAWSTDIYSWMARSTKGFMCIMWSQITWSCCWYSICFTQTHQSARQGLSCHVCHGWQHKFNPFHLKCHKSRHVSFCGFILIHQNWSISL